MPAVPGSLALLEDPVAQELLCSTIPARPAYVWPDGMIGSGLEKRAWSIEPECTVRDAL
jgi:hypothetical protein